MITKNTTTRCQRVDDGTIRIYLNPTGGWSLPNHGDNIFILTERRANMEIFQQSGVWRNIVGFWEGARQRNGRQNIILRRVQRNPMTIKPNFISYQPYSMHHVNNRWNKNILNLRGACSRNKIQNSSNRLYLKRAIQQRSNPSPKGSCIITFEEKMYEDFADLKHNPHIDTIMQPRDCRCLLVRNFWCASRHNIKEWEGGIQVLQMVAAQSWDYEGPCINWNVCLNSWGQYS